MFRETFDPEKFQLPIASYTKHGRTVEIVIDADKAFAFREGKQVDVKDIIRSDDIFDDAQKGLLASPVTIELLFNTSDAITAIKTILTEGTIHYTANFLKHKREEKRRQIIAYIHENALDPSTKYPHPLTRIEAALAQIKFSIDPFESAQAQAEKLLPQLKVIIPISFHKRKVQVIVPAQYAPKAHGRLLSFGSKIEERWLDDAALLYVCEVNGATYERLREYVMHLTHGAAEIIDVD